MADVALSPEAKRRKLAPKEEASPQESGTSEQSPANSEQDSQRQSALDALHLMDLTSLSESDTEESIRGLCKKAVTEKHGTVAAVCVYAQFVPVAKTVLAGSGVKVATVVNFPGGGGGDVQSVREETQKALEDGADEIDVVFPYGELVRLAGLFGQESGEPQCFAEDRYKMVTKACAFCYEFLEAVRAACDEAAKSRGVSVALKVILESAALETVPSQAALDFVEKVCHFPMPEGFELIQDPKNALV